MANYGLDGEGSIGDQVKKLTAEIEKYESKKLGELRTELDGLASKIKGLKEEYEKKYPTLYARWCTQHQQVETLHDSIVGAIPSWKSLVTECICIPRRGLRCKTERISQRDACCQGKNERARNKAKAAADGKKAQLDAFASLAQRVDGSLTEVDKLIKEIRDLLPGPEKTIVLYLFWFKLLPVHMALCPETGVSEECRKFGKEEMPAELCQNELNDQCVLENPCVPSVPDTGLDIEPPNVGLIEPDNYLTELDTAAKEYGKAREALAAAELAYRHAPDDLESLRKQLATDAKKLDDDIKDCLKKKTPLDKCCVTAIATGTGEKLSADKPNQAAADPP